VLIFVHSRKETAKTARYLKEEALREDRLAQFMKVLHFSVLMQFLFESTHIGRHSILAFVSHKLLLKALYRQTA